MIKLNFLLNLGLALLITVFSACDDSEPGNARLLVRLTDAPANYQEVNVEIEEVAVNLSDNGDDSGWMNLQTNGGVYNLLDLTNGINVVLADDEIPAGKISQIRLVLGEDNTLKMDGQTYLLDTPSGQQSGLKIQLHTTLKAGITYDVMLDFDAAQSVVETGSPDKFNLKPVIRASADALDGAITGTILPLDATPVVYAIQGEDIITSAFTDQNGVFLLQDLEVGSYKVSIEPTDDYNEESIDNVEVSLGEISDIGTVELTTK